MDQDTGSRALDSAVTIQPFETDEDENEDRTELR